MNLMVYITHSFNYSICHELYIIYATNYISYMPRIIHHICRELYIIYATNYTSYMPRIIHHICRELYIIYAANYTSYMPRIIHHICRELYIIYAMNYTSYMPWIIHHICHELYIMCVVCCVFVCLVMVDFIHILQGYLTGTGAIIWLPQCQWSNPDRYLRFTNIIDQTWE